MRHFEKSRFNMSVSVVVAVRARVFCGAVATRDCVAVRATVVVVRGCAVRATVFIVRG